MAGIWDLTWNMFTVFGNWIWEGLAVVGESTIDIAQPTLLAIINIIVFLLSVILYLPMRFFGVFIDLLNLVIAALAGMINSVISLGNSLMTLVTGTFTDVLPAPWVTAIGIIILINIILRVYFFAKDISIVGNKI